MPFKSKKKTRILLIDDDKDLIDSLSLFFMEQGFHVYAAHNGASGEMMAKDKHPDIIVLDVMMPKLDGYNVCKRLKEGPGTSDIPILILSGRTRLSDIDIGFKVHADDYMTKPFSPKRLHKKINNLLKEKE